MKTSSPDNLLPLVPVQPRGSLSRIRFTALLPVVVALAVGVSGTLTATAQTLTLTARDSVRQWRSVASSADGTRLVAGVTAGQVYTSTNSGAIWTPRLAGTAGWYGLASSTNGLKLLAAEYSRKLSTSTDGGTTWTARDSDRNWNAVASSADGNKLVATTSGGQIYTSTNSGTNWTARASSQLWGAVASSADGSKLVAVVTGEQIYTSTDSGTNWTARATAGTRDWVSVASSANGNLLVAAVDGGQIFRSTDSGANWTALGNAGTRAWYGVASSDDGTRLVAVDYGTGTGGKIYFSSDSGATWTTAGSDRQYLAVAISADGTRIVAVVDGGQIYTGIDVNHAPTGIGFAGTTFPTDTVNPVVGTFSASDPDSGQTHTFALIPGIGVTDNSAFMITEGTNLVLLGSLDLNGKSTYVIGVRATDNGRPSQSAEVVFPIVFSSVVNEPPSFNLGTSPTVLEDAGSQMLVAFASSISPGSPPREATQVLTFLVSNNNNALFSSQPTLATNGTLTYTPAPNQNGIATVTVTLMDDGGTANGGVDRTNRTFTITVTAVNDAPTLAAIGVSGSENATLTFAATNFTQAYSDVELTPLASITVTSLPVTGTLKLSSVNVTLNQVILAANLGNLTYVPVANANGAKTFTVTASDGTLSSAAATVTMTLGAINTPPTLAAIGVSGTEDTTLMFTAANFTQAYSDADGTLLASITVTSLPATGTLKLSSVNVTLNQVILAANLGNLTYVPVANANGTETFTVTASDGTLSSAAATVTMTLTAVNDAPSFTLGPPKTPSATLTGLSEPIALAFDGAGNLFVANFNGTTVSQFAPGATAPSARLTGLTGPRALAFDGAGNLYVANYVGNTVSKFAVGLNITVADTSGAFSRTHTTAILAGPPEESSQTVSFTVSIPADKAALFSAPPAISANGTLTFTPAAGQSGVAIVTVTAVDSAGAASAPQTFEITVVGRAACALLALLTGGSAAPPSIAPQSLGNRVPAEVTPPISLAIFHALEGLLGESAEGRRLKDLYWAHGPEIIRIMQAQPALRTQMNSVMNSFQPLVVSLLSGRAQQVQITQVMTDQLNTMWNTMTSFASPTLAGTLNTERGRFNGFQDFVGRSFSQWAQMLRVPAPTNPRVHIASVGSTNGTLRLEANLVEGADVALWGTSDLRNWAPVPGAQRQTNGYTLWLTDPSPMVPRRYYRLQTGP